MKPHTRHFQRGIEVRNLCRTIRPKPNLSKQINDRCRLNDLHTTERQITNRTSELLKLTRHAGALTRVVAVVRPRSQLIHEQLPILRAEHLNRQDALKL